MLPILGCSILALGIIAERLWVLRDASVAPASLVPQVWAQLQAAELDTVALRRLRTHSPLGRMLASAVSHHSVPRALLLERVEQTGRQEVHELERYLNTLGSIAAITPLLGLLGTVMGMIGVFSAIDASGLGNQQALAGGIGEALITTGAGLVVAIPALVAFRYLRARVARIALVLEREALKFVDALSAEVA
jgi:biopolymer transport protein ExbB